MLSPKLVIALSVNLAIGVVMEAFLGPQLGSFWNRSKDLISPFVAQEKPKPLPLLKYAISTLAAQTFHSSDSITLTRTTQITPKFTSQIFKFTTTGKTMTGLANIPTGIAPKSGWPVLIMVRGYVPPEIYQPGVGTKSGGEFFAENGFVTLAPDFLGYGDSDPDLTDSWESRFIKPVQLVELIKTVTQEPQLKATDSAQMVTINPAKLGLWTHSNGGQITLTALEILHEPLPASFWAPVTAPFPYSLLYFSDEADDEGKATRNWIAQFERDYDVFDFSLTQHLDLLHGEFQLHHGTADDSALKSWSDEFLAKIKKTNATRPKDDQIKFNYFVYPGANHNLQPGWNTAIGRDLIYFQKQFEI